MVININVLKDAISNLPAPSYEGERIPLQLPDRLQELNREQVNFDPEKNEIPKSQILILTAVVFCKDRYNCWFEWDIEMLAIDFLDLKQKFKKLYISTNEMMAPLGAHGQIYAKDDRVSAVMDALHDIDDGTYDAEKVFNT